MICGDGDRDTHAKTGKNPGRAKPIEAANAVRGVAVFPDALPKGGSDYNDMHLHGGLEAVRTCIEAAIAQTQAREQGAGDTGTVKAATAPAVTLLDRFTVNDEGLWFTEHDNEGRTKPPL